jgi:hypothetical protein
MPDHVMATVSRHGQAFRRCYERARRSELVLGGKLMVSFRVRGDGRTGAVKFHAGRSTLRHAGVERCVKKVFRAMKFRRTGRAVWYSSPLVFGRG